MEDGTNNGWNGQRNGTGAGGFAPLGFSAIAILRSAEETMARKKRPTREDLHDAAEKAMVAAEMLLEEAEGMEPDTSTQQHGDHDMNDDSKKVEPQAAYEQFMAALEPALKRAGAALTVSDRAGWVKIESNRNRHKVYVSRGKTGVRVESSIPADQIEGAVEPTKANGRIASWLPPEPRIVSKAIDFLASSETMIPSPRRGGRAGGSSRDELFRAAADKPHRGGR